MSGAPGIGKSTFAWEICHLWANDKLFTEYDLVILLRFSNKDVREAKEVHDLIEYHYKEKKRVVKDILSSSGPKVLLVLDGYDELSPEHFERSLFKGILGAKLLPSSTVVVTSRPAGSQRILDEYRVKHIELLGFRENDIKDYIQEAFKSNEELLSGFTQYISHYPPVRSMMYIPLNCAILIHMYKVDSKTMCTFQTMTELYTTIVRNLLLRHLKEKQPHNYCSTKPVTLDNLPSPVNSHFEKICELAYSRLNENSESSETDITETLGLLQSHEQPESCGISPSYDFLHSTLQEYLAAYHIFSQKYCPKAFIREHINEPRLQVVVSFLSGLVKPKSSFWKDVELENLSYYLDIEKKMLFLHCLFESQVLIGEYSTKDTSTSPVYTEPLIFTRGPQSTKPVKFFHRGAVTPYDFYVLGHCIAHSKCFWRVQVQRPNSGDWLHAMLKGLDTKQRSGFIKEIDISYCEFGSDMPQLMKLPLQHLTHLVLYHTEMTRSSLDGLTFSMLQTLQYLKLDHNKFENGDLVQLIQSFSNAKSPLTELHLRRTGIGSKDCEALSKLLEVATYLQTLEVSLNYLDCESTQFIIDSVPRSTSMRKLRISRSLPTISSLLSLITAESKLEHLDIGFCKLSTEDLCKFAETIANNCATLQYLSLSANSAEKSVCSSAVSRMITTKTNLRFLFLQDCKLQGEAVTEIASALAENCTLETVDLSKNVLSSTEPTTQFAKTLQMNTNLKRLAMTVDGSVVSSSAFSKLVSAIQSHRNLTSLSLCGSDLGDSGAQIIAEQLISNHHGLHNLLLDKCKIGTDGAHQIASGMAQNSKSCLNFLLMSRNPIGWKGVLEIVDHTNLLKELDLRNTSQGRQEFTKLIESLKKSNLKKLWLSDDCKPYPSFRVEEQLQPRLSFWSFDCRLSRYKHRNILRKVLE